MTQTTTEHADTEHDWDDERFEHPWRDPDLMERLYVHEGMGKKAVASELGCAATTVKRWLDRHGISTREAPGEAPGEDHDRPWRDEETMRRLYEDEGLGSHSIADLLGCSQRTALKWIHKHGFEMKPSSRDVSGPWRDEDTLRRMYLDEGMGSHEIADELGCSPNTVRRWLRRHGIPTRDPPGDPDDPWRDEDELKRLYWEEGMSITEVADEMGARSTEVIHRWMKRFGIPRRSSPANA